MLLRAEAQSSPPPCARAAPQGALRVVAAARALSVKRDPHQSQPFIPSAIKTASIGTHFQCGEVRQQRPVPPTCALVSFFVDHAGDANSWERHHPNAEAGTYTTLGLFTR